MGGGQGTVPKVTSRAVPPGHHLSVPEVCVPCPRDLRVKLEPLHAPLCFNMDACVVLAYNYFLLFFFFFHKASENRPWGHRHRIREATVEKQASDEP